MAKTVLVKYNKPSLYRCGDFRIISGVNEVRKEFWDAVKDNPGVKARLESGEIELMNAPSEKPTGELAKVPDMEIPDEPIDAGYALEELNVKEASKIIKKTYDYATLQDWEIKETRRAVLSMIKKQLAEFAPEKKADEGDDT